MCASGGIILFTAISLPAVSPTDASTVQRLTLGQPHTSIKVRIF